MTHDLDDAIRASLRRNAESAPTVVDLDGVRDRADAIRRRRLAEAALTAVAAVVIALGVGVLLHGTGTNQTLPPPVNSPTATSGPGALPWIAYTNFDANAQPSGATRILVRINGSDHLVKAVPGSQNVTVLGWYGADHQALVWGEGVPGYSLQVLYTSTVSTDGTVMSAPSPVDVRTQKLTPGRAFVGGDGALRFWMPDTLGSATSSGTVVTISESLDGASSPWKVGPGAAAFVTSSAVGRVTEDDRLFVSRSPFDPTGTAVTVCGSLRGVAVSGDARTVALGCSNGHAELVDLTTLKATRIPDIPETADPDVLLGLRWDPTGSLYATTGTDLSVTGYHVHTWKLAGGTWVEEPGEGLLTRWYAAGTASLRLERLTTDGASTDNVGRLIVETDPPVDLGPAGSSVAVRPQS